MQEPCSTIEASDVNTFTPDMSFDSDSREVDIESCRSSSKMPQPIPPILCTEDDNNLLQAQIQQIDGDKVQRVAILSFRGLQLHRIARLQAALVKEQNATLNPIRMGEKPKSSKEELDEEERVDKLLQRYGKIKCVE